MPTTTATTGYSKMKLDGDTSQAASDPVVGAAIPVSLGRKHTALPHHSNVLIFYIQLPNLVSYKRQPGTTLTNISNAVCVNTIASVRKAHETPVQTVCTVQRQLLHCARREANFQENSQPRKAERNRGQR